MTAIEAATIAYDIRRYICIDDITNASPDDFYHRMESELMDQTNPESILLSKEYDGLERQWFEALSEEAKQVIGLITEYPDEMRGIIGSRKRASLSKLGRYLRKQWEERQIVKTVLQEIGQYAARLEAYSRE